MTCVRPQVCFTMCPPGTCWQTKPLTLIGCAMTCWDLLDRDITPVIPPKSNRTFPAEFDNETYKWRHLIENYFGKLKENRGIAMRSCKTDQSFKAFISIAPRPSFTQGERQQPLVPEKS